MEMQQPPPQYPGFVVPPPPNSPGYPHLPHVPYAPPQDPMNAHYGGPGPSINIIHVTNFGPEPQQVTCPKCRTTVISEVKTSSSSKTHIIAFLCCLFGCFPCAPCVYCMDVFLCKNHYCPKCREFLGKCDS